MYSDAVVFGVPLLIGACVIVLILAFLVARQFEAIAEMKGHKGYFWWCLLFGPAGWAMVIALPDRNTTSTNHSGFADSASNQESKYGTNEPDDSLPQL